MSIGTIVFLDSGTVTFSEHYFVFDERWFVHRCLHPVGVVATPRGGAGRSGTIGPGWRAQYPQEDGMADQGTGASVGND
jgi:hypothetical protein